MLYLFQLDGQGDPVGVWAENGDHFYLPDHLDFQKRGELTVPERTENTSWDEWCERLSMSFNPHVHWTSIDYPEASLSDILSTARASTNFPEEE